MVMGTATSMATPPDAPYRVLSRVQAAHLAVERNLDLLVARAGPRLAALQVHVSWRPFVPVATLESGVRRVDGDESADDSLDYRAHLSWSLPTGTVLSATANGTEPVADASESTGALDLSLTQALRKGNASGAGHPLREAELALRVERVRFEKAVEDLLLEVERAYWGLAVAQANVETKKRSVERAQRQYEVTAENIRRGIKPQGDIYFVEGSLVSFREQLMRSDEQLHLARRTLARLLDLPADTLLSASAPLAGVGATIPGGLDPTESPVHRLVVLEAERRTLQRRFEENQAASRLDLKATFALRGDAENPWDDVLAAEGADGRIGLTWAVPLLPGSDNARVQKAQIEVERQAGRVAVSAQRVRVSAGDIALRLEGQGERLVLAEKQVELARKALANAKDQFKNGVSTLNEVVRFQERLDGSMIAAQQAIVDLRIRRAELLQAHGALRDDLEVRVK